MATEGPLDFREFMAAALYHPERGYYARGSGQVGRRGDFFTSVSVGPVFGELLARRFLAWWLAAGRPAPWRIIECGAHDGTLARDVLRELRRLAPEAIGVLDYAICETLPRLQAAHLGETVGSPRGSDPCLAAVAEVLEPLGAGYPDGCRTEVRTDPQWRALLAPLLAGLQRGLMVWIDYGFAAPDYYHPARVDGTLRAFSRHRIQTDPLEDPGAADLTAHVEFTGFARAANALGAVPCTFRPQGAWLADLARPRLEEMEGTPDPQWIRQFQTLVHPAHLGTRFQVIECAWRECPSPVMPPADRHRLAWNGTA
ncbi:MAG: SAM-dependent methyltransferase [Akkermansiaceae bacterium]|nr:SAM-dependent methyltransferase [Akkermansiaceae bacterium]